jgi:hypothetical protein
MEWWQLLFTILFGLQLGGLLAVLLADRVVALAPRLTGKREASGEDATAPGWADRAGRVGSEFAMQAVRADSSSGSTGPSGH